MNIIINSQLGSGWRVGTEVFLVLDPQSSFEKEKNEINNKMEMLSDGLSIHVSFSFFAHFNLSVDFFFSFFFPRAACAIWQRMAGNIKCLFAFA